MHLAAVFGADLDRQDFIVERAAIGRSGSTLMAFERESVQVIAAVLPFVRDHLRTCELRKDGLRIVPVDARARRAARLGMFRPATGGPHGHAAHGFRTGSDDHILHPGHDRLSGEMDGLLRRPALPVDGHRRHRARQVRGENRITSEMQPLLARLADASHDHVVHGLGRDTGPRNDVIQYGSGQIDRMPSADPTVAPTARRPRCGDDICFSHDVPPYNSPALPSHNCALGLDFMFSYQACVAVKSSGILSLMTRANSTKTKAVISASVR